mmetsp:Transcript_43377/g.98050  ORF Transcript_43377/g.98050 Transcript_43377/m.98050 type:complete len:554 (-) Transcript_43377:196-1857(-)
MMLRALLLLVIGIWGECWQIPRVPVSRARSIVRSALEQNDKLSDVAPEGGAEGGPQDLQCAKTVVPLVKSDDVAAAVASLAATTVALLAGDEPSAHALAGGAEKKREMIQLAFSAYDVCESGTLSYEEAKALFTSLARSIVEELAAGKGTRDAARRNAQRILDEDDARGTIDRVASKLLLLADQDGDGKVDLAELAGVFDAVHRSQHGSAEVEGGAAPSTFPQPLQALAGSLQLLPPSVGKLVADAERAHEWHVGVPGDDHTLRHVSIGGGLSVVGLGRSADASAYFLPELSLVFDAGLHVKSLQPKCVLLTHGHRDHIQALPTMAQQGAKIFAPKAIAGLVKRFLLAEAQLNYGDEDQTDEETAAALGHFDVEGVEDRDEIMLPRDRYTGSPTPLGVQVLKAPHKGGVPAVSYGLFRAKARLKPEYAQLPKNELGKLLREDVKITEPFQEGVLFYTGDTTIDLLRERWAEILPKYRHLIHEVTFFGPPSNELDAAARQKGHTHYAQLHPFVLAFPETTFICVHWSLRYSKDDILEFFREQYGRVPKNVVLWV